MTTRSALLAVAAGLMVLGAFGNACVVVPDMHGHLIEAGVRPSVLAAAVHALHFSALAMFGFATIACVAAFESARGITPARIPLVIAGVIYAVTGAMLFARTHSPHHLGVVLMGMLLLIAAALPSPRDPRSGIRDTG